MKKKLSTKICIYLEAEGNVLKVLPRTDPN